MSRLPTVRVTHPDGFAVINEADFDPELHELHDSEDGFALDKKDQEGTPSEDGGEEE